MSGETGMFMLPDELVERILSYCSYDNISHLRLICKKFDRCCQSLLNQGFLKVEKFHAHCLRNVKTQLPRRESERRKHPLARHCDILTAIETRLSLLGMTFMKYVDMNLCCFIPGKVIDEIYRVLRYISNVSTPPRPHEILQELRDISSMAMEHFDEKISPSLKQKIGATGSNISVTSQGTYTVAGSPPSFHSSPRSMVRSVGLRQELSKLQLYIKQLNSTNMALKKEVAEMKLKLSDQKKKYQEQEKRILEQNRMTAEQGARITEQEGKINEVNRKLLDYDRYFADIMAELSRSREESSNIATLQPSLTSGKLNDPSYTLNSSSALKPPSTSDKLTTLESCHCPLDPISLCPSLKRKDDCSSDVINSPKRQKVNE